MLTKMNPTDEKHCIARVQQGETEVSFSPLVRKYHTRLYHHIQKRLRDPEVAKAYRGEDDLVLGFYFSSVHSR